MPFIPLENGVKATLNYLLAGQNMANILWYYSEVGTPSGNDLEDLCDALISWWSTEMAPFITQSLELTTVTAVDWSTVDGGYAEVGANITGALTGGYMPTQNAACITFTTASRGRSYRGRNYVVGLVESQITGNLVDTSVMDGLVGAYADLPTYVNPVLPDMSHVIASFYADNAPRTSGVATAVTNYTWRSNRVRTQRRRNNAY